MTTAKGGEGRAWWSRSTIPEVLDHQAERRGDQAFLILDGEAVTYRALRDRTRRGARALARLGVGTGDRVAVMMATSPEWVTAWLAAARLGAVTVPVNTAYRGDFLANQLADATVGILAVDESLLGRVAEVVGQLPSLRHVLVRHDDTAAGDSALVTPRQGDATLGGVSVLSISCLNDGPGGDSGLRTAMDGDEPPSGAAWNTPAAIFYTSGTTGRSKGAVCTHHYLLAAADAMVEAWQFRPGEVMYAPLPLFHVSTVGSVLGPMLAGGTGVIDRVFSVTQTWDRVRATGASGMALAGPMVVMLWNLDPDPRDRDLPIRFVSSAPVPADLYRAVEERYDCKVVTCYGLSEAFPVTVAGIRDDNPPGASGHANPRLDVAVVDDEDDEVPAGTLGEIVCRPREPHVILECYEGAPAETLERMTNLWFHTGDLGRVDEQGNLTYVDRKKDAIRRRGENISSFEVEQTIMQHPAVAEVAAIAVPSDVGEDDVMVCVTTAPGAELDMVEFMDFCVKRMPYFAVPRYVNEMTELPKNTMGRVLKPILRDRGVSPETWDRERADYVVRR